MKKFMKAIAFVTVMCMALSTVAFADNGAEKSETDDKTVIVTVTEAGADEQVALYIVEESETASTANTPLFIYQKGADENGDATFTAKIAEEVDAVRVFVGYAANKTNSAVDLGPVTLKEATTKITVTKVAAKFGTAQADSDIGEAWTATFTVNAPQGSTAVAKSMIWAITYKTATGTETVYSDPYDDENIENYGIGAVIDGSVTLAVAFNNGTKAQAGVEILDVDAIFMFNDESETVVATNPEHLKDERTTPVTE